MTEDEFRQLALTLPEAVEASHLGQPDFRVRGKICATLGVPRAGWGTLKLTPEQQRQWMEMLPGAFTPAPGAWGRRGWTHLELEHAGPDALPEAMSDAWRNVAPKSLTLARLYPSEGPGSIRQDQQDLLDQGNDESTLR